MNQVKKPVLNQLRLIRTSNWSRLVQDHKKPVLSGPVRFFEVSGFWWTGISLGLSPWRSKTKTRPDFQSLVTSWHWMERNGAEVDRMDVMSSTRVPLVKIRHQFRCMNIIPRFPGIVLNTETFPFDQVTQFPVNHLTIQDFLHHPLFFAIHNFQ